jgi:fibronectin type 3 domain-containing protein
MLTWNAVPGATRYVISRSTTSGSGYTVITSGFLTQPAGGSGQIVWYTDTTAENGTEYYYVVQSYSPYGTSAYSAQVSGEAQDGYYSTAPDAPTGLTITDTGDRSISLSWDGEDDGTSLWSVYRTTLASDNSGDLIPLRTILLDNSLLPDVTTYTDTTVSNGEQYSYYIVATDPEGSSGPSNTVTGKALPPAPDSAPEGFGADATSATNVNLSWSPVSGAEGYDVYRSTTANSFTWPADFVTTTVQDTYADTGVVGGTKYYYQVTPVNAGGIGPSSTDSVTTP